MLSKSLKHEFRATTRVMLPVFLALLAVSAVTWGVSWVSWYLIENKLTAFLQSRLIRAGR